MLPDARSDTAMSPVLGSPPPGTAARCPHAPFSSLPAGGRLLSSHLCAPLLVFVQFGFMRLDQTPDRS